MDLSLAVWHLLGFVAPAFGVAVLTVGLAKLVWRGELSGPGFVRLTSLAALAGAAVLVTGLLVTGHDGTMATYAALVAVCAGVVWWFGF